MALPVAIQLYSLRDEMEKDFKGTLKAVKEMGYDGVEFAGLYGNDPADVKAMCEEIGLVPISAHVTTDEYICDGVDVALDRWQAVGVKYVVIPYLVDDRRPGAARWKGEDVKNPTYDLIKAVGEGAQARGMHLLYHNHDFEFKKVENGEFGLDFLYSSIPADLLQTELDECWVKYAGQDPVAYLQKYTGRAPVVHSKDYYVEGEQVGDPYALIGLNEDEKKSNSAFEFRPLGCGVQDVAALMNAAEAAGSKWLIVEQDQPSMGKTPMECVAMSMEYVKKIKAEKCQKDCQKDCPNQIDCKKDCPKK